MKEVIESMQVSLFKESQSERISPIANGSGFSDPAFAINKESPIHRWVPWIAGFSRSFVSDAIKRHLHQRATVLDPFAGVGTTLVEAILLGHNAVGFEINPYAAMACQLKTTAHKVDFNSLKDAVEQFDDFYNFAIRDSYIPKFSPPPGFHTRAPFYSPKVLKKVLIFHDFVKNQLPDKFEDLFLLAFAATMITYSNYSYEPSLSRRVTAGKQEVQDFQVGRTISFKLRQMTSDMEWIAKQLGSARPIANVYNESIFNYRQRLANSSIDLIVTSPPYLNNYHYNRNTRPHLYWLGFAKSPNDLQRLEKNNFGKYWQTVREKKCIELDFPNPDSEIIKCLNSIRAQKPEKGIYGGNGWANYAATYFNDCYRFACCIKWLLRRRATALIVIGNNIIQGVMIPTDQFFAKIADRVGLKVVDIHIPRETRVGNSIIQSNVRAAKANKSYRLYEAVVELQKK